MIFKFILTFSCFLIISSCDLPNEADNDCNDINLGSAYIDECGRCVGGDTSFLEGYDKDVCGICFGNNDCTRCNDKEAINYIDINKTNFLSDDALCIYDLCTDYIESNNNFNCETNGSSPYDIGEALGCKTLETEFDTCYPEDCGTIKLADFEDKIIFIIYEQDW